MPSRTTISASRMVAPWITPNRLRALLTMFDQGVVSVANFVGAVIVGRACSRDELGVYGLGFMIVMLLTGIPRALVQTPYTTFFPRWTSRQARRFSGSAAVHTLMLGLLGAVVLLMTAAGIRWWDSDNRHWLLALWLAPILMAVVAREHARRTCLAWHSTAEVVALDLCISLAHVTLLWGLSRSGSLSGITGLMAWGGANAAAAFWYLLRAGKFRIRASAIRLHAGTFWAMSRWLLGGAVAALLVTGFYRLALSGMHGMAAMGVLTSAQSLVMIANPIVLGLANYLTPAMATFYATGGLRATRQTVGRATLVLLLVWGGLLGALWFGGGAAVEWIFGDKYAGIGQVVFIIGLGFCTESLFLPVEAALTAANRARLTFLAATARLLITVTLGALLIYEFGVVGVGYAMIVANLSVLLVEGLMYVACMSGEH